ncbi:hypothetical protein [Fibrella aestuarina]|uniref:hypothetical protein n=1 Tax=Fibrella aestuarina TaxID=651143 RepID=UPI00059CD2B7|nr:hypothetical protein [Fibrella aestuarina]
MSITDLRALINAQIKANGAGQISGPTLQTILITLLGFVEVLANLYEGGVTNETLTYTSFEAAALAPMPALPIGQNAILVSVPNGTTGRPSVYVKWGVGADKLNQIILS